MSDVLDIVKFQKAPCYRCGYNGHSYYQPDVHQCAKDFHRIRDLMGELTDPLIAAQRVFVLENHPEAVSPEELAGLRSTLEESNRCYLAQFDRAENLQRELGAKQAQIDRLMIEYCPDEMTPEQVAEWEKHQKPERHTPQNDDQGDKP